MNRSSQEQLADRIILLIRTKPNAKFKLEQLAKKLKVTPQQMNSAVKVIKEWGYKINLNKLEVSFQSAPDILSATEISYELKNKLIGRQIHSFNSVKSTNIVANQLADKGAPEGTIVTAEKQTLGKGRLGRSWHSPEKVGIYLSIILRPKFSPDKAPGLSVMSALAVAEALSRYCADSVQIKWPNDVLINGRKVAGVLTELDAEKNKINHVVVGIGINVNQTKKDFPKTIGQTATSVGIESSELINRVDLLKSTLRVFEKEYRGYQKNQLSSSLKRIRKFSSLINKDISVKSGSEVISGKAVDIDKSGSLIILNDSGRKVISSGEVTVLKE